MNAARFAGNSVLALLIFLGAALPLASGANAETLHFGPEERASWGLRNVFAFLRPGFYYGERKIVIETNPPGAVLDLFYVRSNFQKGYEQTESPVTVVLPSRIEAGPRDSLTIRAYNEGFRQEDLSVKIGSSQSRVLLELEPLPNTLRGVSHTYFGGRGSVAFLTDEPLALRVQNKEAGFNLILSETARGSDLPEVLSGAKSPLVRELSAVQLGEDLLVQVHLQENMQGKVKLRSRQGRDPIRELYTYQVDLLAKEGEGAVERALEVLAGIQSVDVTSCALRFDGTLRDGLDPADLARALTPRGSFTDPYLRAAMRRLGEVSPSGVIELLDGSQFRPGTPIELAAALSQASQAKGFLALLRRFVTELDGPEHRVESLRSLVAPETSPTAFESLLEAAESAERSCRV